MTRRPALAAVALMASLAVGVVGGRASIRMTSADGPTVDRTLERRTPAGAVAAAARWLDASDTRDELLNVEHRRQLVADLVADRAKPRIGDDLDAAADALTTDGEGPRTVVRSAPMGYRVASFDPRTARIETWETVTRSAFTVEPSVLWARSSIRLRWEGRWRIDAARSRLASPGRWTASDLAAMDVRFNAFRHVP